MIRANDLTSTAALWSRPLPAVSPRADVRDAAAWFDGAAAGSSTTICGDLSPDARGLSVEQHASRVLMHLRDDGDRDT
jgi:hypothetical protein